MSDDAQILANHLITLSIVDYDDVFVKSATELRRLDALVKEQAQEIERLKAQRVPQVVPSTKAQFYVRVSNISGQPSGVFLPNADGSAPDVELRSESMVPVVSAQRVPLTEDQLIDAYCKTLGLHQFVSAFVAGARFAEAAHGIHPLQRLADLSKEIGEKL